MKKILKNIIIISILTNFSYALEIDALPPTPPILEDIDTTPTVVVVTEEEVNESTEESSQISTTLLTNIIADTGINLSSVEQAIITNKIQYEINNSTNSALSTALTIMGLSSDAKLKAKNSGNVNGYVQNLITTVNSRMTELEE
jgi:hypothetical protein